MVSTVASRRLGNAFVEVAAETDGFEDSLEAALDRAVTAASKSKNFDPIVDAAGDAGERASKEFGRRFRFEARERGPFFTAIMNTFSVSGLKAGFGFFSQFVDGFAQASKSTPLIGSLAGGLGQILKMFGGMGVTGALGSLATILPTLGILIIVVPLLTSAIFALGGAILSLLGVLGALPGLAAGLLATIAPLVIAFQGFGEAISAIASGDLEKINEALKKLTPSARLVAKEFQKLMPFFSQLRKDVQETFFGRLVGALTKLMTAVGPALSGGLQNVAFALGTLISNMAKLAGSPAAVDFLANLFQAITDGISAGGPTILGFLTTLMMLANTALPVISDVLASIGGAVDEFSKWAQGAAKDGSFERWVREAFETLGKVVVIGKELFGLLVDMFGLTGEAGQTFLDDVAEAIRQLREFFQSPEGKEFIENMITLAEDFGDILIWVAGVAAYLVGQFAAAIETAEKLGEIIEHLIKRKDVLGDIARIVAGPFGLPFAAEGGVFDSPVIAAEAGTEAILPLTDPVRAREVLNDPQVTAALGTGGGTTVWAIFDGEPFQARVTRTVKGHTSSIARDLTQQPRAGV